MKWRNKSKDLKNKEPATSLKERVMFLELMKEGWTDPELLRLDKRITLLEKALVEVGTKVYEQPKPKKVGT